MTKSVICLYIYTCVIYHMHISINGNTSRCIQKHIVYYMFFNIIYTTSVAICKASRSIGN